MVSKKLIEELRLILKEEYGWDMSYEEASKFGNFLVHYYSFMLKHESKEKKIKK